jgi:O-antigen ligase
MVFAVFIYAFLYKNFRQKKWLYCIIASALLLLFTVSTKGYILILLSMFFYGIFSGLAKGNIQKILGRVFIVSSLLALIIWAMYQVLLLNSGAYFAKRVLEFSSIAETIEADSSAFVRIGLPMIAIKMFLYHPLLGLGAGGYHFFALDYIQKFMPFAMNLNDVIQMRKSGTVMSAAIIFQVLANFGLYGFVFFVRPLFVIWKRYRTFIATSKTVALLFSLLILFIFQSGNWAYMHMWFLFAFFSSNFYDLRRCI